jgi:hypothetical protein
MGKNFNAKGAKETAGKGDSQFFAFLFFLRLPIGVERMLCVGLFGFRIAGQEICSTVF